MWEIWEGGWTRNVQTGRCLFGRNWPDPVFTDRCVHTGFEFWRSWHGGWKQVPSHVDQWGSRHPDLCLSRLYGSVHDVTMILCRNPNGPNHPRELWYQNRL